MEGKNMESGRRGEVGIRSSARPTNFASVGAKAGGFGGLPRTHYR